MHVRNQSILSLYVQHCKDNTHFRLLLAQHGYVRVKSVRLLGIVTSLFVLRKHLLHLRKVERQYLRLSLFRLVGLKGCVAIRMRLYGVSYCFINCHLTAHEENLTQRVEQYRQIVEGIRFKRDRETSILNHEYEEIQLFSAFSDQQSFSLQLRFLVRRPELQDIQ